MKRPLALMVFGALAVTTSAASAQVGHLPQHSPYVDLEFAQELSIFGGTFHGHRDPANVGPGGGALVGLHYEWRAGGPAILVGDFSRVQSSRQIINPFANGAARDLGSKTDPLYMANVGLGLSLTGGKSWHNIVPIVAGGLGLVSNFQSKPDSGGFRFGTRFALNWGGGIRWVPGGRWQVRGDFTNRLYTMAYPDVFYVAPAGGTAVASPSTAKSFWTNNPAFTLGISRLF